MIALFTPLLPGDLLLYRPNNLWGWIIAIKTWAPLSHIETYLGRNLSAAARDGIGVGTFPTRGQDLALVLRPFQLFHLPKALAWHRRMVGQRYDWMGLLIFFLAAHAGAPDRMFCSEHTTRLARAGGIEPFNSDFDADRVAPATFLASPAYYQVWPLKTSSSNKSNPSSHENSPHYPIRHHDLRMCRAYSWPV